MQLHCSEGKIYNLDPLCASRFGGLFTSLKGRRSGPAVAGVGPDLGSPPPGNFFQPPPQASLHKHTIEVQTICLLCKSILKMPLKQAVVLRTSQTEVPLLPLQTCGRVYGLQMPLPATRPPRRGQPSHELLPPPSLARRHGEGASQTGHSKDKHYTRSQGQREGQGMDTFGSVICEVTKWCEKRAGKEPHRERDPHPSWSATIQFGCRPTGLGVDLAG